MSTDRIPPTKFEYYGEDPNMPREQRLELFAQESREATGLLWSAIQHVSHDAAACALMHRLRDSLITELESPFFNNWAQENKTLYMRRVNTVGPYTCLLAGKFPLTVGRFNPNG